MKIKSALLITSILSLTFGIGFLIMPTFLVNLLNFAVNGDGPLAMRFSGIMILGISILAFKSRSINDLHSLKVITFYLAATYSMMLIFHLILQLFFQVGNVMLWAVDILHLVLGSYYWNYTIKTKE